MLASGCKVDVNVLVQGNGECFVSGDASFVCFGGPETFNPI